MTKEAPELKANPGVRRVPNSTQWHYVKKVPKELAEHPEYAGKQWAFRGSLGTSDLREANRRAALKLVELEAHWARLKQQANPVKVSDLSPEVVTQLAEYIRFCVFNADDYRRDSPQVARRLAVMRDLAAKAHPLTEGRKLGEGFTVQGDKSAMAEFRTHARAALSAPVVGHALDDHSADALEAWNKERDTQAGKAVARRNHEAILRDAQAAAQWLGVSYDWHQEAARPHLLKLLEAKREALEELTRRDAGKVVPTPAEPIQKPMEGQPKAHSAPSKVRSGASVDILKAAPSQVFMRDILSDWAKHGRAGRAAYPVKTIAKYTKAVERFESLTDNPSMSAIDRPTGAVFKRALKDLEGAEALSDATVTDTIINCGTLLNHYARQTGRIGASLWAKLTDKAADSPQQAARDEWTESELQRLFGLPVWQRYELPQTKNAGLDAAYWVPLLGLFTGARITELCQLRVDDFTQEGAVWFLRMAVTHEGQSLKKADSWRTIPIPQGVIDLGLIDYRQHIMDMGQEWLFPGVTKESQNNAGGGVSKWFSVLKIANGFRDNVVFHSFRGSLNTVLIRLGVAPEYRCRYIGHKPEGGVNMVDYNKLKPADLVKVSEVIAFPFLELPKVYAKPSWFPGWKEGKG